MESVETQKNASKDIALVQNILNTLIVLQSHLSLYGSDNQNVALTTSRLCLFLQKYFAAEDVLTLHIARHGVLYRDAFVDRKNDNIAKLAYRLFQHGIAALTFKNDVSPNALQSFLVLVNRKPSETWDEGGFVACLYARDIRQVLVREMAAHDILLSDELSELDDEQLLKGRSRLWDKFTLSVCQALHLDDEENFDLSKNTTPQALATATNEVLQEQSPSRQSTFARDASRYLLSLKHEPIADYRNMALKRLTTFVNHLTPALRRMFLSNAYNLNIDHEMVEKFLSGLSDDVIMQALKDAANQGNYAPPVVTKLLGKLAQSRDLNIVDAALSTDSELQVKAGKIKDLFKPDDFQKYVPDNYQKALLSILENETVPTGAMQNIDILKQTLEQDMLDDHLGIVLFDILRQNPDPDSINGLAKNLVNSIDSYIGTENFRKGLQLYQRCLVGQEAQEQFAYVVKYVSSRQFTDKALDASARLNRARLDELRELICFVKKPFIPPLLDRLSVESNRTLRMFYLQCLKGIGSMCVEDAVKRLESPHWYVTRNILYLLRELGDPVVMPQVRKALGHQHPNVYQEALKIGVVFNDKVAVEHLVALMDSSDTRQALSAIALAGVSDNKAVLEKLLSLLGESSLGGDQLDKRKTAVRALAVRANQAALPVLSEVLNSRSLLHPQKQNELKLEIISSLEKFPVNDVLDLVRTQTRSKVPELAHKASMLLKRRERSEE